MSSLHRAHANLLYIVQILLESPKGPDFSFLVSFYQLNISAAKWSSRYKVFYVVNMLKLVMSDLLIWLSNIDLWIPVLMLRIGPHQGAWGRSEASQKSLSSKHCCEYDMLLFIKYMMPVTLWHCTCSLEIFGYGEGGRDFEYSVGICAWWFYLFASGEIWAFPWGCKFFLTQIIQLGV